MKLQLRGGKHSNWPLDLRLLCQNMSEIIPDHKLTVKKTFRVKRSYRRNLQMEIEKSSLRSRSRLLAKRAFMLMLTFAFAAKHLEFTFAFIFKLILEFAFTFTIIPDHKLTVKKTFRVKSSYRQNLQMEIEILYGRTSI